mmetsp:Transcript_15950/g.24839  ORF Transcript_15950/g.24839 Transcript_15950/m.24839 type:complete len:225 (+) Transcript_15950:843-1517(+)
MFSIACYCRSTPLLALPGRNLVCALASAVLPDPRCRPVPYHVLKPGHACSSNGALRLAARQDWVKAWGTAGQGLNVNPLVYLVPSCFAPNSRVCVSNVDCLQTADPNRPCQGHKDPLHLRPRPRIPHHRCFFRPRLQFPCCSIQSLRFVFVYALASRMSSSLLLPCASAVRVPHLVWNPPACPLPSCLTLTVDLPRQRIHLQTHLKTGSASSTSWIAQSSSSIS